MSGSFQTSPIFQKRHEPIVGFFGFVGAGQGCCNALALKVCKSFAVSPTPMLMDRKPETVGKGDQNAALGGAVPVSS